MKNLFIAVLIVPLLITGACKKEKSTPPYVDFTGCKITSISKSNGTNKFYGNVAFYSSNQLYSYHSADTTGAPNKTGYYQYKFWGNLPVEYGEVVNGIYTMRRRIQYDGKSRPSLLQWFHTADSSILTHRLYYNGNDWCTGILKGRVQILNGVSTSIITDSIAFKDFTVQGYPAVVEYYAMSPAGNPTLTNTLKYEYDSHGNILKQYHNNKLHRELEYDLSHPYNKEYIELQESLLWGTYLIHSDGLLPGITVGKYPPNKITLHNSGASNPNIVMVDNTFDNAGRFISQKVSTPNAKEITTYNYECK